MGRDTYSESYTSRQEIVPLDESTQAGVKEKLATKLPTFSFTDEIAFAFTKNREVINYLLPNY